MDDYRPDILFRSHFQGTASWNVVSEAKLSDSLSGVQIGLIGFERSQEPDVRTVVSSAGALSKSVRMTSVDVMSLRGCDSVLLNANRFHPNAIQLACSWHAPILAVGGLQALRRTAAGGYKWANDLLGSSGRVDVMRGADLSINGYLVKPASPTWIWRRIKDLLKPAQSSLKTLAADADMFNVGDRTTERTRSGIGSGVSRSQTGLISE